MELKARTGRISAVSARQLHITDNFTLVTDEKCRVRVDLELADQGMIDLGCYQLVEHLHGRRKENAQIGLAGFPSDDL